MFIVKIGNRYRGFVHYGPFNSFVDALKWKDLRRANDEEIRSRRSVDWIYDIVELFNEPA